jgi:hypothetical protein
MKKTAKELLIALWLFITLGTFVMGIIYYQEHYSGGLMLSVISLLLFFILLFGKNDD